MPRVGYVGYALGTALAREGLLPPECRKVELHMPVDGVVFLRYEVNVLPADVPKLARAIASLAQYDSDHALPRGSDADTPHEHERPR